LKKFSEILDKFLLSELFWEFTTFEEKNFIEIYFFSSIVLIISEKIFSIPFIQSYKYIFGVELFFSYLS